MEVREKGSRIILDIDRCYANSVRQELNAIQSIHMSIDKFTICRVPSHIRKGKEKYYDPSMVAIGPYHRSREHLQPMKAHKLQYLNDFLARNTNHSLEVYVSSLRENEDRARRCYFDHIDLESEEFVKMLLIDGCFIIELFLKWKFESNEKNIIQRDGWLHVGIVDDLFLLENQIPFFVINILFDLLVRDIHVLVKQEEKSVYDRGIVHIITPFFGFGSEFKANINDIDHLLRFGSLLTSQDLDAERENDVVDQRILTSLLRRLKCQLLGIYDTLYLKIRKTSSYEETTIPSASKLIEYGVKIKKRSGDYSMINIVFKDGVLEIPPNFKIGEEHKRVMFNILAFEQSNISDLKKLKLSTYFQFMDFLIDTPKDVEILQECGILTSYLESAEDTALLFNQLNHHAYVDRENHYLVPVYKEINKFCYSKWHRNKAMLKRDYFSNPWAIISLIAAVILLILTFLQTFFAVYGYFKPPS